MANGITKNVTPNDVALIELASGRDTAAPLPILRVLRDQGYLRIDAKGTPTLTAAGRERGKALRPTEGNLRTLASARAAGRCAITGVGGSRLQG